MRALVVDDTMCLRHILHHMLRDIGFAEVEEAADGMHALKLIKAHPFDLVLTDLNMPKLDGLALLKQIRSNPFTTDLPVLMITSAADKEHLTQAIRADVSGFLAKPFNQNALEKQLKRIGFKTKPEKVS